MTKSRITDLNDLPVTEVEIEAQSKAAIDVIKHADKSARYAKWLKGQIETITSGELDGDPGCVKTRRSM